MTDRRIAAPADLDALAFDAAGLLPVVAQDAAAGTVLMVAWANREALERTLASGRVHFWSRSRGALWMKGETSGNLLDVVALHADCDGDTVLARVRPAGPACHTGEWSCFGVGAVTGPDAADAADAADPDPLRTLWTTLQERAARRPEGSYTARLLDDPNLRIKKVGEEAAELIQAVVQGEAARAAEEVADLWYHTLVALLAVGGSYDDVVRELRRRR